jgi:membrane protease YdiL (CAAX protease family)
MERPNGRETWKLAGITAAWLLLTKGLSWLGDRAVPDAVKANISLQTFQMTCQITTAVVGLGLCFGLLERPLAALALTRTRPRQLAVIALLAPAFLVSTTVIAIQAALPTLLEEVRTRGAGVSRQNAGEFGRMLEQGPLLATLLWSVILAATTEELLFRGALWSLVERLVEAARARVTVGKVEAALLGLVPTVVSAAVFGMMHYDLRGGVGIVRLTSTTLLGLGAGALRRWTGTLAAPVLLHFLNNTMAIGLGRKWFASDPPGPLLIAGVPNGLLSVAVIGVVGAALLWGAFAIVNRRAARDRAFAEGAGPS